jgi:hypothetical protein
MAFQEIHAADAAHERVVRCGAWRLGWSVWCWASPSRGQQSHLQVAHEREIGDARGQRDGEGGGFAGHFRTCCAADAEGSSVMQCEEGKVELLARGVNAGAFKTRALTFAFSRHPPAFAHFKRSRGNRLRRTFFTS